MCKSSLWSSLGLAVQRSWRTGGEQYNRRHSFVIPRAQFTLFF
jgi:hypothetical protein